jgi:ubiquinone/menaquinone biosynthesis C-methylase UbiE
MPEIKVAFDNADAYERYMGRWSRAVGEKFLAWLDLPKSLRWLDVGCGSGAFSELVGERCAPKSLSGVDPSAAQIEFARSRTPNGDFRVADAMSLPHRDGEFDVVASALVLHFIPDRARAFAEMKRVAKPGSLVTGYTWERTAISDFAPYAPMMRAIHSLGVEPMQSPTVPEQSPEGLRASVQAAGLAGIEVSRIEASQTFRDFDDYWEIQTLTISPAGKTVAQLDEGQRARLRHVLLETLPAAADGTISYPARAVAFKARA